MAKRRKTSGSDYFGHEEPSRRSSSSGQVDKIIEGLLERLPEPGTYWPEPERQNWIQMMLGAFKVLYLAQPPKEDEPAQ